MLESMKPYLGLAAGLTEVTATKAAELAQGLLAQGSAVAPKPSLSDLGMDPQAAEALLGTVREEVDRVAHRLGFVREDELVALRRQVERLESDLAQAREDAAAASMLAAAEQATGPSAGGSEALADTVLASARRVIDIAGALDAVSAIPGGPWARVARDVASSAASLVQSAAGGATLTGAGSASATPPATPQPAAPMAHPEGGASREKHKKAKGKGGKSGPAKPKKGAGE